MSDYGSWQEDARTKAFFGRKVEQEAFETNLTLLLDDEQRHKLYNIYGQSGVGKSWLLGELIHLTNEDQYQVSVLIDKDVSSTLEAMDQIATHLETLGLGLPVFRAKQREYHQKRSRLEGDRIAPEGLASLLGAAAGTIGGIALKYTPLIAFSELAQRPIEAGVTKVAEFVIKRLPNKVDQNLILDPLSSLTPSFLADLRDSLGERTFVLFIDTFEKTGEVLEGWLQELLKATYGIPPVGLILVIAGQNPLDPNRWSDYLSMISPINLEPFTDDEIREYLSKRMICDKKLVEVIIHLTGGLPVWVDALASQAPADAKHIGDISGYAVDRFLTWTTDPQKRKLAIEGALPRFFNEDVLAQIVNPLPARELFDWLRMQPFIERREEHWEYKEVVRRQMLRHQRRRSLNRWNELHTIMANFYNQQCEVLDLSATQTQKNINYQNYSIELLYHRYCVQPTRELSHAIHIIIHAMETHAELALRYSFALKQAEHDCEVHAEENWGELLIRATSHEDADTDYERQIELLTRLIVYCQQYPPMSDSLYFNRAISYFWIGKYDEAMSDINIAITLAPDVPENYVIRFVFSSKAKDYDRAIDDITKVIVFYPNNGNYLFARGVNYHKSGQYDKAIADESQAIGSDPNNAEYYHGRSKSYHESGQYDKAIEDATNAINLDPVNAVYHRSRSISYFMSGQNNKAFADDTRAIELDPTNAMYYQLRALDYLAAGLLARALNDQTIPESGLPTDVKTDQTIMPIELFESVIVDQTKAIELNPTSGLHYQLRGLVYCMAGQFDNGIADQTKAIELSPSNALYYQQRGESYHETGLNEKAIEDYTRSIELEPANAKYYHRRGVSYHEAGQYGKAIEDFTHAINLDPLNAEYYHNRGMSFHAIGQDDKAQADEAHCLEISQLAKTLT